MRGYLAQPVAQPVNATGLRPGLLVIHENRGLNPYIEDVARRAAVEGFIAFAPDALTPVGGYPGDEEKARELFSKLDAAKRSEDMVAAAEYLYARKDTSSRIGVVGFCYGGGVCNLLASRLPWLAAAERINAAWPAYEQALRANGVRYEAHHYSGTQHGFHNDTTPRYDETAAKLAWSRALGFLRTHLR